MCFVCVRARVRMCARVCVEREKEREKANVLSLRHTVRVLLPVLVIDLLLAIV